MKHGLFALCLLIASPIAMAAGTAPSYSLGLDIHFTAPSVFSRANLAQAVAGDIVYDSGSGAFYGLPPGVDPTASGGSNWIALSAPVGSGYVMSSDTERMERVTVSTTCATNSTCTMASNTSGIVSVTSDPSADGLYTVHFNTAPQPFSTAPTCVVTTQTEEVAIQSFPTTSSFQFETYNSGASTPTSFMVLCMGH